MKRKMIFKVFSNIQVIQYESCDGFCDVCNAALFCAVVVTVM